MENQEFIETGKTSRIISVSPIVFNVPGRAVNMELRVTAPVDGDNLPVILLSHGGGTSNFLSSYRGLAPLVDFWASQGFVVIQPTHLSSGSLKLDSTIPGYPIFAISRVEDMKYILDHLQEVISAVPTLTGRVDKSSVAVAGHSGGGLTAAMLLGAHYMDNNGNEIYLPDERIKAGVLFAVSGEGSDDMPAPWGNVDIVKSFRYSRMNAPALVVAGDKDISPISSKGVAYYMDAYFRSPGNKSLITVFNGEHMLGGLTGYDALETTDENPERVAFIQNLSTAYLKSLFNENDASWKETLKILSETESPLGKVESKTN